MYDVAVVGVGPPGARYARRAAEAGYDVLALEKGEIGSPLACSGHVSTDLWEYVPDDAVDRLRQNRIYGADFHVGGAETDGYRFYKREEVSNVIDRVELDRTLADCAREAGADVRDGHTVTDVDERSDRVVLTASVDGDSSDGENPRERRFEARIVAGCDGPTSRIRRTVGLPEPEETLHGVLAFDSEPDHGDYVDVHLTAPRFFAWRIPRGDAGVEYGLAAPPGTDVKTRFDRLVAGYGVETERFCSGAIPIGPPTRTTSDRVFLLGDAAAQTKPFTGGGILYGMTAADIAAETIDPADPSTLSAYERAWREELGREIRLGSLIRRAYSLPEPIQRAGLWALSGEIGVHMDRPTSFFSREHLRRLFS
ncbi:geranylgeranyl reductase [Halalkaliarchaeum desulfuricum]|uniref:Geranylgeranyl reductase n=1 Tax=Halalkaliarchaeum desulfuricum TaxID=2055893 RepID=A0A343TLL1_9EURY|nr:geranylgeranyl reductase family protein [Halalkaliarchaeum desulfuricum]AUX09983.1 geranylgeranyl reductase [Halalkaliarchaeum desulfuricum]